MVSALMADLKALEDFARVRLGEIAEHDGVFEIHGRWAEQKVAHEVTQLRVKQLEAADEPQVVQEMPCEERDDGAIIAGVIHHDEEHGLFSELLTSSSSLFLPEAAPEISPLIFV